MAKFLYAIFTIACILCYSVNSIAQTSLLRTTLDSTTAITTPVVGPSGQSASLYFSTISSRRGPIMSCDASCIAGGMRRRLSWPATVIPKAGSIEFYYRPNHSPTDTTRHVLFYAGSQTGTSFSLERSDRVIVTIVTSDRRSFIFTSSAGSMPWSRWTWNLIRVEWNPNKNPGFELLVNNTPIQLMGIESGWSITGFDEHARFHLGGADGLDLADGAFDDLTISLNDTTESADAGVNLDAETHADAAQPDASVDASVIHDAGIGQANGSSGCGTIAYTTGVSYGRITVDGLERTYVLVVPSQYSSTVPMPLTFGWHGNYWTGSSFRTSTPLLEQASAGTSIFVYPDGLNIPSRGTGWILSSPGRDVAFYDALRNRLLSTLCVDQTKISSYGRSYGAFFQNLLTCVRGNQFRSTAVLSGGGPSLQCSTTSSVFIYHSQDDITVGFNQGVATRDAWLRYNGCSTAITQQYSTYCVRYTQCERNSVVWCPTPTGGHWPAAWTSAEIWRFLSSF